TSIVDLVDGEIAEHIERCCTFAEVAVPERCQSGGCLIDNIADLLKIELTGHESDEAIEVGFFKVTTSSQQVTHLIHTGAVECRDLLSPVSRRKHSVEQRFHRLIVSPHQCLLMGYYTVAHHRDLTLEILPHRSKTKVGTLSVASRV